MASVKKAITAQSGVLAVDVRLADKQATVRFEEGGTSAERLLVAIEDAGYPGTLLPA